MKPESSKIILCSLKTLFCKGFFLGLTCCVVEVPRFRDENDATLPRARVGVVISKVSGRSWGAGSFNGREPQREPQQGPPMGIYNGETDQEMRNVTFMKLKLKKK